MSYVHSTAYSIGIGTMVEYSNIATRLLSGNLSQREIATVATQSVKKGNIPLAELAYSLLESEDAILKLYRGRLLSLKGDFQGFIDFSDAYSESIRKECTITDALSPWYWRQGIAYAVLNQNDKSDYIFDRMRYETCNSRHELAHYYQCFGAVSLSRNTHCDKAQELLINSMTMYLKDKDSDEPFYSVFDNIRCIVVNLIMQVIIDLKQENYHIAYRKLLYCREWVHTNAFSIRATGISEIATLFKNNEYGWVFEYVFCNDSELISLSNHINNNIMLQVLREDINYQSLSMSTFDSSLKAFQRDYLLLNNFPKERYRKSYYIHMEDISMKSKKVFIIHGRDKKAYDQFVAFLTSLRLDPIEWDQAIGYTNKPSPYIGEIIEAGFEESQAIIVLLTPDEKVRLKKELQHDKSDSTERFQPRPNVIFEAGFALAKYPQQTIFVQMGKLEIDDLWSDIHGRHSIMLNNDVDSRRALINRLIIAGCTIDITGSSLWITQGDLNICN